MRFGVLGPIAAWTADGGAVAVPGSDVRVLLAALLAGDGNWMSTDRLIGDLWPGRLPANPANALQVRVSRLRRALEAAQPGGRALVEHRSSGYRLRVPVEAVDAGRFAALLRDARAAGLRERTRLLSEALALWRGPAYTDVAGELFVRAAAQRLAQQRLAAVEELAAARLDLGEHDDVVTELVGWVLEHPDRERLRAVQMRALYRAGRHGEALAAYDDLRRRLADEQGLDPGPELVALQRAILARDPALDAAPRRTTLPSPITELIGRETAIDDVRTSVAQGRLVTLTGPGGVGKTRLAVAAAAVAEPFPDGVWLVELAGVSGIEAVAEAVMAVLGVRENTMLGPVPTGRPMSHADRLSAYLAGKRLLLVLDNCEHVTGPAAQLVRTLLHAAPGLRVLATSREPLGVPGEAVRPVAPLALPPAGADVDVVRAASAVRLFCARAADADPGFALDASNAELVAALVREVDGLPLALELAAGRVRALGVHGLAGGIGALAAGNRGGPARQRSMQAVLDWSWELLTPAERVLLRRLAVLDGGRIEDIASIGADGADGADGAVTDVLAQLVDRSMVTVTGDGRYLLLRTISSYAAARLAESGEADAVRDRHAAHYLLRAEAWAAGLHGRDQDGNLARLDVERGNLHCAVERALDSGAAEVALRLVDALAWYLLLRGRVRQAHRWAGRALAVAGNAPPAVRARVRCWAAGLAVLLDVEVDPRAALAGFDDVDDPPGLAMARWFLAYVLLHGGDLDTSEELAALAVKDFEALGHVWGMAVATSLRAHQALARGDLGASAEASERALALFRSLGDRGGELLTTYPRAVLAEIRGDQPEAERLHRDGLRLAEDLGMWAEAADRLSGLGRIAMVRGAHDAASELHQRAADLAAEHGFTAGEVYAAIGLGQNARRAGDLHSAHEHLSAAAAWYRRTGRAPGHATVLSELGFLAEQRGAAAEAAEHHEAAIALARRLGDPRAEAVALEGLAGARLLAGRPEEATRLLAAAQDLRSARGAAVLAAERGDLDRIKAKAGS